MNEPRKKPGWVFWTTIVLFVVIVAYPLSVGPVFAVAYSYRANAAAFEMATGTMAKPKWYHIASGYYCTPLMWLNGQLPEAARAPLLLYLRIWL